MRANITHIKIGEWESYTVNNANDCKTETDKIAYIQAIKKNQPVQIGSTLVEFNNEVDITEFADMFDTPALI